MRSKVIFPCFILCTCTTLHAEVMWEVVNRFPLFSERAFVALQNEVNPKVGGLELQLTQVDYRNKVRHLEDSAWDANKQTYDTSRVLARTAKIVGHTEWGEEECNWSLTPSKGVNPVSSTSTCNKSPQFTVELGQTYEFAVTRASGQEVQRTEITPKSHLIISLGDSFSSGEGNPDYPAKLNGALRRMPPHDWAVDSNYPAHLILKESAQWLDPNCHRSILSWPALHSLRQAISRKDTVVQFLSFACSGAEIIDGFLLPQKNPPGNIGVESEGKTTYLLDSQQSSVAKALCDGQTLNEREIDLNEDVSPFFEHYKKRKPIPKVQRCSSPTKPNEVLVQFGGNDARFAGIVKYTLHPPILKFSGLPIGAQLLGTGLNQALFKALAPVKPADAETYIGKLPLVYELLNKGLLELSIQSHNSHIRFLEYPDPTIGTLQANEVFEELESCRDRTRDANRPVQSLIALQLRGFRHDGAHYGITPKRLLEVQSTYIPSLQRQQAYAAKKYDWSLVETNSVFKGKGICAGSLECDRSGLECPNSDRVRWAFWPAHDKNVSSKNSPPWEQLSDFSPYDPLRLRGMRYANDALLTGARFGPDSKRIRLDWIAGIAHPTAAMHAKIAESLTPPTARVGQLR